MVYGRDRLQEVVRDKEVMVFVRVEDHHVQHARNNVVRRIVNHANLVLEETTVVKQL